MSLNISEDVNLKQYNTFKVEHKTKYFCQVFNLDQFVEALDFAKRFYKNDWKKNILFLGEGSNMLFVRDFEGLIIKNNINNTLDCIKIKDQNDKSITLNVGSGLNWDYFVEYCCDNKYYGIENLSYIPGTVGAAPVQNIGAYGVEVSDFIESIEVYDCLNNCINIIDKDKCNFAYRSSIFKETIGENFFILSINFKLSKIKHFNINYKDIRECLKDSQNSLEASDIRKIIIEIRNNKLPDWKQKESLGTAGSFFKNPIISKQVLDQILLKYPDILYYETKDGNFYKLSAGYIIDNILGYKNITINGVGTYKNQALVIVNFGKSSGQDILKFSDVISQKFFEVMDVVLEKEVNII